MKKSLLAIAVLGLSLSAPAFAQSTSENATFRAALENAPAAVAQHFLVRLPSSTPAAAPAPLVLTTLLSASPFLSNTLPCIGCVNSDPTHFDLGVVFPVGFYDTRTKTLQYTVALHDNRFTGTCTIAFALVQGTKVVDSGSTPFPGLKPNLVGVTAFNRPRPRISGAATLLGFTKCGSFVSNKANEQLFFL